MSPVNVRCCDTNLVDLKIGQDLLLDHETLSNASTGIASSASSCRTASRSSSASARWPATLLQRLSSTARSLRPASLRARSVKVPGDQPCHGLQLQPPPSTTVPVFQLCHELQLQLPPSATVPLGELPASPQRFVDSEDRTLDFVEDLFSKEHVAVCPSGYLPVMQPNLHDGLRAVLVDWLVEIHRAMSLKPASLFLGVSLLDRYLSKCRVKRGDLQLVGVTCLLLAAKFEEVDTNTPTPDHLVFYTQGTCTKESIVQMECRVLAALGYEVMVPTCQHFLEIFQQANGGDAKHSELVNYMSELTLMDSSLTRFEPSHLAAGVLLLANGLTYREPRWPVELVSITRHSESSLAEITGLLANLIDMAATSTLNSIVREYSKEERFAVAAVFAKSPCAA